MNAATPSCPMCLVLVSVWASGCAAPMSSSSGSSKATSRASGVAEAEEASTTVTTASVPAASWDVAEQLLRRYEQIRNERALDCWRGLSCETSPALPEFQDAEGMVAAVPADRRHRDIAAGVARTMLDATAGRYRDLPLLEDHVAERLAEASAAVQTNLGNDALPLAAWGTAQRAVVARAQALHISRAELLARRAAMTRQEVVVLASEILNGADLSGAVHPAELPRRWGAPAQSLIVQQALVGPLVDVDPTAGQASNIAAPFAGCFLVLPPENIVVTQGRLRTPAALLAERYARGAARGARLTPEGQVPDMLFVKATAHAAMLSAPQHSFAGAEIAARLRLRWAAASSIALLDDKLLTDPAALDALATRVVGGSTPKAGVGRLLGLHPSGRVIDELVARVAAAAMLRSLENDLGSGWAARQEQRHRAADLLLLHFAEWRQNGLVGLFERANVEDAGSLHPLGLRD